MNIPSLAKITLAVTLAISPTQSQSNIYRQSLLEILAGSHYTDYNPFERKNMQTEYERIQQELMIEWNEAVHKISPGPAPISDWIAAAQTMQRIIRQIDEVHKNTAQKMYHEFLEEFAEV